MYRLRHIPSLIPLYKIHIIIVFLAHQNLERGDMANNPQSNDPSKKRKRHRYAIEHIKIPDHEYGDETPKYLQNQDIPGFPSTILAVGPPGGGKTNVLMNFLTRKDLWNGFFDKIYLLGPTVKSDPLYKQIKIADDQQVENPHDFIPKLKEWTEAQIERVKADRKSAPKCLFVFEDITSYHSTVQNQPDFAKCFNAIRHHKASAYANVHKYKAFNRTARMCCMHVMAWKINNTEIKQLYEDYGPSNLCYKDFERMCYDIWTPDERSEKPFLYINRYKQEDERYRRCFEEIINLEAYEGLGRRLDKIKKIKDNQLVEQMLTRSIPDQDGILAEADAQPLPNEPITEKKEEKGEEETPPPEPQPSSVIGHDLESQKEKEKLEDFMRKKQRLTQSFAYLH